MMLSYAFLCGQILVCSEMKLDERATVVVRILAGPEAELPSLLLLVVVVVLLFRV